MLDGSDRDAGSRHARAEVWRSSWNVTVLTAPVNVDLAGCRGHGSSIREERKAHRPSPTVKCLPHLGKFDAPFL